MSNATTRPTARPAAGNHSSACDRYVENLIAAQRLVDSLRDLLADAPVAPEDIHWGHVGDIARDREALQEIHDRMTGSGEYAEVA